MIQLDPPETHENQAELTASSALFDSFQHFHHEYSLALESRAKKLDVTTTGLRALILIGATQPGTVTPSTLKFSLRLTSGTITTLVDKLETARQLIRLSNSADRRSVFLMLTPEGQGAVDDFKTEYSDALFRFAGATEALHVAEFVENGRREICARFETGETGS